MTDEIRPERRASVRRATDPHGRPVYSRGPIIWTLVGTSVVATIAAVAALIVSLSTQGETLSQQGQTLAKQRQTLVQVRQGREFAVGVTCAVESAVAQAGYDVITRGAVLPDPLARFFEQHGYPPPRVRDVQARAAGHRYVQTLARDVAAAVGPGVRLIRADGALDCNRLAQLSKTRPLHKPGH